MQDTAGRHHSGHHRQLNVVLLQQTPPASFQACESSVDHSAGRGEGAGEAPLLGGALVLLAVAFHQPRLQGERGIPDEMDGQLHPIKHDRFLKEKLQISTGCIHKETLTADMIPDRASAPFTSFNLRLIN